MVVAAQAQRQVIAPEQKGPAEKLFDLVLGNQGHVWHGRPGVDVNGTWRPAPKGITVGILKPGIFVPGAVNLYSKLLEIYQLSPELFAHFASYSIVETEWRDLKIACAALMLVQKHAGLPILDEAGKLAFYDDDYRGTGEAMMLWYRKGDRKHSMSPKSIMRVAKLLEVPEIAQINRRAGFGSVASTRPPMGRWRQAAQGWLAVREKNLPMLEGLVKAGYKETIKAITRKAKYQPETQRFFEILGWKQEQHPDGHRTVGLKELNLRKADRMDGMAEGDICALIEKKHLGYKEVVGRLPREVGLTPAIMVALLPSLSDRDLRILTPTLEQLDLLKRKEIRERWEKAIAEATDQRAINIAKNVANKEVREKLLEASDAAARKAVAEAIAEKPIRVFFLIDKSGSMQRGLELSKEALSRILAGFPPDKLHIALFDATGYAVELKAPTRAGVQHMLSRVQAAGGTMHGSALAALRGAGVTVSPEEQLVVIVVGDEAGEDGQNFARAFARDGYTPAALATILAPGERGMMTVEGCARHLGIPYSRIDVSQFDDAYQVPRVLRAILEAPATKRGTVATGRSMWLDKILATPILRKVV